MTTKEGICKECYVDFETWSGLFDPSKDCMMDECPHRKEIIYKLPNTRPQVKKHIQSKEVFKFEVDVEIDKDALSGSEYKRLKSYIGTNKGLKETIQQGVDLSHLEFRETNPLKATKIKVRKIG
ncbi:MAG: hypothetical protein E4H14_08385 [Candidatus Thorarchaeota archaeon]|nr:MAG: hypothetical protein E4H14_08385 [Candidatus Thorarchaeota archaeon]